MIDDIEDGKINCVVTKDLSRLGRNYILTGQYTEIYFPSKGVRYIAINDNVDTINGESELAPFLNILNEMHARQTSKKVKAAGRITEYNFNMLSEKYQNEQKELETKIRQLHETMEAAVQTAADAEKWIALMKQYVNPVELTAELLNTLIEKITVHEAVKGEDGSREQEVEIYYRFIGKID